MSGKVIYDDPFQDDTSEGSGPTENTFRWQKGKREDTKEDSDPPTSGSIDNTNGGSSDLMIPKKSIPKKARAGNEVTSLLSESMVKEGGQSMRLMNHRPPSRPPQNRSRTSPPPRLLQAPLGSEKTTQATTKTKISIPNEPIITEAQIKQKEAAILSDLNRSLAPLVSKLIVHTSQDEITLFSSSLKSKDKGMDWGASFAEPLSFLGDEDSFDSKIPMFPDEFDDASPSHPLKWWGVSLPPKRHVLSQPSSSAGEQKSKSNDERRKRKISNSDNRSNGRTHENDHPRREKIRSKNEPQSHNNNSKRYPPEHGFDTKRDNMIGHTQYCDDGRRLMGPPFDGHDERYHHGRRHMGADDDQYGPVPVRGGNRDRNRGKNERR